MYYICPQNICYAENNGPYVRLTERVTKHIEMCADVGQKICANVRKIVPNLLFFIRKRNILFAQM